MEPPILSMPAIPVHFHYVSEGALQKSFRALCTTVPRAGEVIFPQGGSAKVIVHVVAYRAETPSKVGATMIPNVYLRELTPEEQENVGRIFNA